MNKTAKDIDTLDRECIAFSYYLIKQEPSHYVLDKYRDAHETSDLIPSRETNRMDQLLLNVSIRHPFATKLVDSYTSIFFKTSMARRKWILLLAILESCAPSHQHFDSPDSRSRSLIVITILWKLMGFLITLCVSTILFTPCHVILNTKSRLLSRYYVADANEV